ncbi:hypothetical protein [Chitinophaga tropicalis]|uniref:Uncharacterized protein n=1 Tax=Chitinophaga tropicalis TaxID=2683588 RepID=A0A7K1U7A7_9BACT|nr:hypothetical protein [Chitinophaga tropicalis]MVT10229.1 hypothetical protein [Chitinophaga tropicalis]
MPENQFEAIMAAIQGLTVKFENRFDKVEAQLVSINGELKRIEHWTPYNANQDIVAKLAAITARK